MDDDQITIAEVHTTKHAHYIVRIVCPPVVVNVVVDGMRREVACAFDVGLVVFGGDVTACWDGG